MVWSKRLEGVPGLLNVLYFQSRSYGGVVDSPSSSPLTDEEQSNGDFVKVDPNHVSKRQFKAISHLTSLDSTWSLQWAKKTTQRTKIVIFFPGDGQLESSILHEHPFASWDLEKSLEALARRFPDHHIVVVKPCHHVAKTKCVYRNFVECDPSCETIPIHTSEPLRALPQLYHLLEKLQSSLLLELASSMKGNKSEERSSWNQVLDPMDISDGGLNIIGFSSGCIVLNQIIYELASTHLTQCENIESFADRITSLTFIDGGHGGNENTFVTDHSILKDSIVYRKVACHVVCTPYQIRDPRRPILAIEAKEFVEFLKTNSPASFKYELLFEDQKPSIENHFYSLQRYLG